MKTVKISEKIKDKIVENGECLEFTGSKNSYGYGRISICGKYRVLTRLLWEEMRGRIPDGMLVCHTCDNPACVRIDHLFLGTPIDNVRDMTRKGRDCHSKGTAIHNGLTEEDRREALDGYRREVLAEKESKNAVTRLINQVYERTNSYGLTAIELGMPYTKVYYELKKSGKRAFRPKGDNPDLRQKATDMRVDGFTLKEIAKCLGVSTALAFSFTVGVKRGSGKFY